MYSLVLPAEEADLPAASGIPPVASMWSGRAAVTRLDPKKCFTTEPLPECLGLLQGTGSSLGLSGQGPPPDFTSICRLEPSCFLVVVFSVEGGGERKGREA